MIRTKRVLASFAASAMLSLSVAAPAALAQEQDGLVNVAIGDITVQDVNVNVAAQIAAGICAQDVNVLAVDEGAGDVVCQIGRSPQTLRITQN
jgi:hypothetical protein